MLVLAIILSRKKEREKSDSKGASIVIFVILVIFIAALVRRGPLVGRQKDELRAF